MGIKQYKVGKGWEEEIWRVIEGYEGLYWVSNFGRIKSKNKILKLTKRNYVEVGLIKNGVVKTFYVHRLVANAFIPNPNNYFYINHKDENKLNNHVDNLEWCTKSYNNNYGTRTQKTRKKVCQYDINNNFIKLWDGIRVASRGLNIPSQQISQCCNNTKYRKTAGGYIWKYESEVL